MLGLLTETFNFVSVSLHLFISAVFFRYGGNAQLIKTGLRYLCVTPCYIISLFNKALFL